MSMILKDLLHKLFEYNLDAEVKVVVHNKPEDFTIAWGGGGEGATKREATCVDFYVDRLNRHEESADE